MVYQRVGAGISWQLVPRDETYPLEAFCHPVLTTQDSFSAVVSLSNSEAIVWERRCSDAVTSAIHHSILAPYSISTCQ